MTSDDCGLRPSGDALDWWTRLGLNDARAASRAVGADALDDLRRTLHVWEEGTFGDSLVAARDGATSPYLAGLRALLDRETDRSRAAALAFMALGPGQRRRPDGHQLAALRALAAETHADVLDLVVAWGSGWRRRVLWDNEAEARWPAAVMALRNSVEAAINAGLRWLESSVPHLREVLHAGGSDEYRDRVMGYGDSIAVMLAAGGCRCGHGNRTVRRPLDACGRREHHIETWQPERCRLQPFVATAVRGSAEKSIRPGAFGTSMLYAHLREDHLVRVVAAEFRVCHGCHPERIRAAVLHGQPIRIADLERGLYDQSRCPTCGRSPAPDSTYHTARKNWLIVPVEWGGQHEAAERFHCLGCGNLFATHLDHCPLCQREVHDRRRRTSIWVRSVGLKRAA